MSRSLGLFVALVTGACIELPAPLRERVVVIDGRSTTAGAGGDGGDGSVGGGDAGGGVTDGGAGGGTGGTGGTGGGGPSGPLPICTSLADNDVCATIVQIAAGVFFTCALASDGHVWCWGSNWDGELGDPSRPIAANLPPGPVPGLTDVQEVFAGTNWACAKNLDGVSCWGGNDLGQLGLGDTMPRAEPTPMALQNIDRLVFDNERGCAVTTDDHVYCWGRLLNGQPWYEDEFTATPTPVAGTESMASIALLTVGEAACVLSDDGLDLRCWGLNDKGYVGDGTTDLHLAATPVASSLATPVELLAAGNSRTCAVGGSPRVVQCWGSMWGSATLEPTVFAEIDASQVVNLEQGWAHLCLRDPSDLVTCWGKSVFGELGPSGGTGQLITTPVSVIGDAALLDVGWQHSCVVTNGGDVMCWGRNQYGQVQPNSDEQVIRPPSKVSFPAPP